MKIIVVGLGFGDECKGTFTDFISAYFGIDTVVRYNGGCQAAHNVYVGSIHHVFCQFGSATLNNAKTILSEYVYIEPLRLLNEAHFLIKKGFTDIFDRLYVSEDCVIVTPVHRLICCLKELSQSQPKGSVGVGIGETVVDHQKGYCLKVKDLTNLKQARLILNATWARKIDLAQQLLESNPDNQEMKDLFQQFIESESVDKTIMIYMELIQKLSKNILTNEAILDLINYNDVIFEGTQGTLIDPNYGFFPHVTRTSCTIKNAKKQIQGQSHSIGLIRAYLTRHGPGPFPTESDLGISEENNSYTPWQKDVRFGWLDLLLLRYALNVNQEIDSIGFGCVDKLANLDQIKVCTHYYYHGKDLDSAHRCFDFESCNPRTLLNLKVQHSNSELMAILPDCIPVYQSFPSWPEISVLTKADDLPKELKEYINYIEEQVCVPISIISYGPDRQQKLFLREIDTQ